MDYTAIVARVMYVDKVWKSGSRLCRGKTTVTPALVLKIKGKQSKKVVMMYSYAFKTKTLGLLLQGDEITFNTPRNTNFKKNKLYIPIELKISKVKLVTKRNKVPFTNPRNISEVLELIRQHNNNPYGGHINGNGLLQLEGGLDSDKKRVYEVIKKKCKLNNKHCVAKEVKKARTDRVLESRMQLSEYHSGVKLKASTKITKGSQEVLHEKERLSAIDAYYSK